MPAATFFKGHKKYSDPNYAWLEKVKQTYEQLPENGDPAILHGIIAEGSSRLKNIARKDPLLAGYIRLAVAEAHMNLALLQDEKAEILAGISRGRRLCEQATKNALAEGCGVASLILPNTLTLLTALYKAFPDARKPSLVKSIQKIADSLDEAHFEQTFLREQALNLVQSAQLLLASFEDLDIEERQFLLGQALEKMINAGDLYCLAGDIKNILIIQSDIEAIQQSLTDPHTPQPLLSVFKQSVDGNDLLPGVDLGKTFEPISEKNHNFRAQSVMEDNHPQKSIRSTTLRWVISLIGLIISCLMSVFSTIGLYSAFSNRQGNAKANQIMDQAKESQEIEIEDLEITAQVMLTQLAQTPQAISQVNPPDDVPEQAGIASVTLTPEVLETLIVEKPSVATPNTPLDLIQDLSINRNTFYCVNSNGPTTVTFTVEMSDIDRGMAIFWRLYDKKSGSTTAWQNISMQRKTATSRSFTFDANVWDGTNNFFYPPGYGESWFQFQLISGDGVYRTPVYRDDITFFPCPQ